MDGDGFLEAFFSFSSKAFCNGRPFGCSEGKFRTVARPDVGWRGGLAK